MSRSYKKPIIKDKGMTTHEYWSVIRSKWKQLIKKDPETVLPSPKSIHDDYTYSDWKFEINKDHKDYKKYLRK